jgi:hypothetical protein
MGVNDKLLQLAVVFTAVGVMTAIWIAVLRRGRRK